MLKRRTRMIYGCLFCVALLAGCTAQNSSKSVAVDSDLKKMHDAGIEILDEPMNMGPVPIYSVARRSFKIINHGSQVVTITHIDSDCSCTTVTADNLNILPHKELSIPVEFNATGIASSFERVLKLRFAVGSTSFSHALKVIGSVQLDAPVIVFPQRIEFLGKNEPVQRIYVRAPLPVLARIPDRIIVKKTGEILVELPEAGADEKLIGKAIEVSLDGAFDREVHEDAFINFKMGVIERRVQIKYH